MVDSGIEINPDPTQNPFTGETEEDNSNGTCISQGILLPFIPDEGDWDPYLRGFLYMILLMYCLLGLTVISDVFLGAIERITTQTKKKKISNANAESETHVEEIALWNDTVANLTLISLALSAPEILLAVIEVFASNFKYGYLGSGTLIGCSGFQILMIPALISLFITKGSIQPIKSFKVFILTNILSIIGFIWLFLTLDFISSKTVEIWESILFPYFLIVLLLSWLIGRNWNKKNNKNEVKLENVEQNGTEVEMMLKPQDITIVRSANNIDKEVLLNFYKKLRHIPDITDGDVSDLIAMKLIELQPHSRIWYRIDGIRRVTGSKRLQPALNQNQKEVYKSVTELMNEIPVDSRPPTRQDDGSYIEKTVVEFKHDVYSITKNVCKFNISVIRHGRQDNTARVRVESFDGTAKQGRHYTHVNKQLAFGPYIKEKEVTVIINDEKWKPELEFFLKMTMVDEEYYRDSVKLGKSTIMEIRGVESIDQIFRHTKSNKVYYENYKAQFQGILRVNGGNSTGVNCFDWFMHVILFPWKLISALIPPGGYVGGWLCFIVGLIFIAFIAVLVGDATNAFACIANFDVFIMAILFLPVGFGIPDIISSKCIGSRAKNGDIVIGYNGATNLFRIGIGLGLPWLISTIYQEVNEEKFEVNSGNLSFSSLVYSCAGILGFLFLVMRRYIPFFSKSEFGGSGISNWLTGFVLFFLWETFVVLVALKVFNVIMWEWND